MKIIIKIVISIALFAVLGLIMGALQSASGSDSAGGMRLVIGAGLIGGLYAIWKKDKKNTDNIDNSKLDKN